MEIMGHLSIPVFQEYKMRVPVHMRVPAIKVIRLCTYPVMSLLHRNDKIFLTCKFDYAMNNVTHHLFPFLRVPDDVAYMILPLVKEHGFRLRSQIVTGRQAGKFLFLLHVFFCAVLLSIRLYSTFIENLLNFY